MKLVKKTANLEIDIDDLASKLGLHKVVVEVLAYRGIDTYEAINSFVFGVDMDYYDPLLLKNMQAVADRLKQAKTKQEMVIIYGDYDCDGVSSAAILKKAFDRFGINCQVHIPKRNSDGYGLNNASIERLIETYNPDLIITCDCGISAVKEVEYAIELGVDVIITDHHEPSAVLPPCLVVNPKIEGCIYPDKNLCGAGVALKVAQSICGMTIVQECVDIACVATVGDMVALLDENRYIVRQGLKKLNSSECNLGLKRLIQSLELNTVCSGDIAYKISPRINVCGRIGDAFNAYRLLVSDDIAEIDGLIQQIACDNDKRRIICEQQFEEAKELVASGNLLKQRSLILINQNWEKGITGILAARLANEFGRPSFVLTGAKNNILKGTARSCEGINLFDMLTYAKDTLIEFGGHKQAAGFSIEVDNVDNFKRRINEYMSRFDNQLFFASVNYDVDIDTKDIDCQLVKSLDILEPFGVGFERPIFCLDAEIVKIENVKNRHSFVTFADNFVSMCFFNKDDFRFEIGQKIRMAFDLTVNTYGKKYPRGICKAIEFKKLNICQTVAQGNTAYTNTFFVDEQPKVENIKISKLSSIVDDIYGCLIVCGDSKWYTKIQNLHLPSVSEESFLYTENNNLSKIVVAPVFDSMDLRYYDKIVLVGTNYLDCAIAYINSLTKATIYIVENRQIWDIDISRQNLLKIHQAIKLGEEFGSKNLFEHMYKLSMQNKIDVSQLVVGFRIFEQLGLLIVEKSGGFCYRLTNKKTELCNSSIYKNLLKFVEKN